jgi:eukaryotic-like serine/threonine-protein kinase
MEANEGGLVNGDDGRKNIDQSQTMNEGGPADAGALPSSSERNLLGTKVGSIRFVDFLGKGGMGEVYVGYDEKLQRKVALKALTGKLRSQPEARARFVQEARVLSKLEHPHICRIYDLMEGKEEDLLVLELIQGEPLQRRAKGRLTWSDKLRVAREIAEVLVATHEKGIVHRDLKPQNIMLTDQGSVKVLDFGLSRLLTDPEAATASLGEQQGGHEESSAASHSQPYAATRAGSVMGTLGYMSPEQAQGKVATPASDMYSFGLVLQELFSGQAPCDASPNPQDALDRAAKGESRPFADKDSDLVALVNRLKAPEPGVRPSAVDALDRLIWIEQKPRRRRQRILASVAVSILFLTTIAMILLAIRAHKSAVRAEREAETAREVSAFLTDLFRTSDPTRSNGRTITAREILNEGSRNLKWKLNDQPEVRATLMRTVGDVYEALGMWQEAAPFLEEALASQEARLGPESPEVALTLKSLGLVKRDFEKYAEAKVLFERALAIQEKRLGADAVPVALTLDCIGQLQSQQGMASEALKTYQRELGILEKALGTSDPAVARCLSDLGMTNMWLGQYEKAEEAIKRALKIDEKASGMDTPMVADDLRHLSALYGQSGRLEEAVTVTERCLHIDEACYGPEGDVVAQDLAVLSEIYRNMGRFEDSLRAAHRALEIDKKHRGPESTLVAQDLEVLSQLYAGAGKYAEAEAALRDALFIRRKVQGEDHPQVAISLGNLGDICLKRNNPTEAVKVISQSQGLLEKCLAKDPNNAQLQISMAWNSVCLGIAYKGLGNSVEARKSWEQAAATVKPMIQQSDDTSALDTYAQALIYLGRLDEARPVVNKLLEKNWRYPPFIDLCKKNRLLPKDYTPLESK